MATAAGESFLAPDIDQGADDVREVRVIPGLRSKAATARECGPGARARPRRLT
jgi:hypothetical protein